MPPRDRSYLIPARRCGQTDDTGCDDAAVRGFESAIRRRHALDDLRNVFLKCGRPAFRVC